MPSTCHKRNRSTKAIVKYKKEDANSHDVRILEKLGAALLVGGLVGAEREYRDKAAGFRTIIFITVGATLFTMFSTVIAGEENDPARIAANIVTGIGFLGAGAIMRERSRSWIDDSGNHLVGSRLGHGHRQ